MALVDAQGHWGPKCVGDLTLNVTFIVIAAVAVAAAAAASTAFVASAAATVTIHCLYVFWTPRTMGAPSHGG